MIGIYAPYDLTDVTTMALSLGDYALGLGYNVSYFCPGDPYVDLHATWDRKIKTDTSVTFYDWVHSCSHIVWFAVNHDRLALSLKAKRRNSLVITNAMASKQYHGIHGVFDCVVVPSIAVCEHLCQRWKTDKLHPIPWVPRQLLTNKPDTSSGRLEIYVPLSGLTQQHMGHDLLCLLGLLLKKHKNVAFTVGTYKRFAKSASEIMDSLRKEFPGRLRLETIPSQDRRADNYRDYDWTMYLSYKDDVYIPALQSLSVGTPVISLAAIPSSECVLHEYSGFRIACDVENEPLWDLPLIAKPDLQNVLSGVSTVIENPDILDTVKAHSWTYMQNRKQTFNSVWRTVWDEPNAS
jgi:hypothetical protein